MFDLVILGGGPGGYHSALLGAEAGLSVALIEKARLGGVCLNEGCIPSKTLLNSAKYATDHSAFALDDSLNHIDFEVLQKRKDKVINTLVKSIGTSLKKEGVTVVNGAGFFVATKSGFACEVGGEIIKAKHAIVATGSTPIRPNIPGADLPHVLTSTEMLNLTTPPKSLVVIGGGVIGLEMASVYAAAGSDVTVVEMHDQLAGHLDRDLEKILRSSLKKQKITMLTSARCEEITEKQVVVETAKGIQEIDAKMVLMSIGRVPCVFGYGLENLDLEVGHRIEVNKHCETSLSNLFAIGDVNGKSLLAHTAYREAEVAINTILGKQDAMVYDMIPSVIYTRPEVASVGLTEAQAVEKGISITVASRPFGSNGRFLAETDKERGLCKVVLDATGQKILGVHLAGLYASEMIATGALLVQLGITKEQLASVVLPHPTVSEIIKDTILGVA